jgi:hypothetical protein
MRSVVASGRYDQAGFIDAFIKHLTTPGRNHDPYTEIYTRREDNPMDIPHLLDEASCPG